MQFTRKRTRMCFIAALQKETPLCLTGYSIHNNVAGESFRRRWCARWNMKRARRKIAIAQPPAAIFLFIGVNMSKMRSVIFLFHPGKHARESTSARLIPPSLSPLCYSPTFDGRPSGCLADDDTRGEIGEIADFWSRFGCLQHREEFSNPLSQRVPLGDI